MTRTRERRFVCPETARRDAGDRARATIGRGAAKTDIRRWRVSARARGAREGARRRARARRRADDRTSRARRWSVASSSDARGRRRGDGGSDRRARRARATRARATRDARRATNGDRIEARARGLTFLGDDGDDDDARDARLRRRRRRSTATIVSALDVEVDDDGRGARAVERARRWVPMAQVRAKEHQGIVVSAVVLPVHGARVSGEEEDGIATRE